jgi:hypothetical protein
VNSRCNIFTSGVATSENIIAGVHDKIYFNHIRKTNKFSFYFMFFKAISNIESDKIGLEHHTKYRIPVYTGQSACMIKC